eukprot:scaffold206292_cov33-Tisochrysis_lutea.AAC.3
MEGCGPVISFPANPDRESMRFPFGRELANLHAEILRTTTPHSVRPCMAQTLYYHRALPPLAVLIPITR